MSYPKDLDEYAASELRSELEDREINQESGNCDYCGRPVRDMPYCKFPKRHSGEKKYL